jgi:hypothetical protein
MFKPCSNCWAHFSFITWQTIKYSGYFFSGLIPALILAGIAWNELTDIQKTSQGDFLLRLHDEFNDRKIQDVMYLIYIIDRRAKVKCNSHEERDFHCNSCENIVIE